MPVTTKYLMIDASKVTQALLDLSNSTQEFNYLRIPIENIQDANDLLDAIDSDYFIESTSETLDSGTVTNVWRPKKVR